MAEQMSRHDARQVYGHQETLCMQACVHAIFNIRIYVCTYIRYTVTKRACLTVRRAAHMYNLCITWYQLRRPLFLSSNIPHPLLSSHTPHPSLSSLPHSTPPHSPPTLHTPLPSFLTPRPLTLLPHSTLPHSPPTPHDESISTFSYLPGHFQDISRLSRRQSSHPMRVHPHPQHTASEHQDDCTLDRYVHMHTWNMYKCVISKYIS